MNTLDTRYHGLVKYDEKEVIYFKNGIPGFEKLKRFILFSIPGNEIFRILHSLEDTAIGFTVISPFDVCSDYEFVLSSEDEDEIEVKDQKDVLILNIVTLSSDVKKITVNLKAPLIINTDKKLGKQIILNKEEYLIKQPLFKEE